MAIGLNKDIVLVGEKCYYGKVQSVKILPKKDDDNGTGVCATVAFIDIKSAAKAQNAENKIEERTLKTDYYEPPASSTASSAIFIHERDDALVRPTTGVYTGTRPSRYQHGLTEERTYERGTGHYYDRVADRESYLRRPMGMGYHDDDSYQGRGKSRDRYQRTPTSTGTYQDGSERTQNHFRGHNSTRQHFDHQRYSSDQYSDERDVTSGVNRLTRRPNTSTSSTVNSTVVSPPHSRSGSRQRQHKRRSPSHSPSRSRSNSCSRSRSRSRSTSGSHSSSSSSKLRSSSSDSSSRSRSPSKSRSPAASYGSQGSSKGGRSASTVTLVNSTPYLPSAVTTTGGSSSSQVPTQTQGSASISVDSNEKDEKRPLGICVKNLPVRSTDTSLKDGLFHEYKKHGKVTMVKVIGQGTDRYAVVCFKKPEDVEKALEVSKDKLFFGCRIEVTAHEGIDGEDNEFRPLEAELDEYHPKATRTLFIGNLEKDITTSDLRKHFEQFGEIIEIDIKKQGSSTSYAFIQYSDVASVVKAMRKLDGENLGANRIKLGFGKSMPTNCVWLDGIADSVTEKFLSRHFGRFGPVVYTAIDREKGHSLIFYDSVEYAQIAVSEMRGRILGGKRLQVDFASRECQTAFFEKMEMTGQMLPGERPWERRERRTEFEVIRDDRYGREARVGFDGRNYARYDNQQRITRGTFSRGTLQRGAYTKGKGQGFPGRFEPYHEEFGDRWHRNFEEEYSQGNGASFEDSYEHELREYGYSQRERREYANEERSTRGRSFSPVRRRDAGSVSPPLKERHRDDVSSSPHSQIDRSSGRVGKHDDHHSKDRYNSRDEDIEEGQNLDGKNEHGKFGESDRQFRKKKLHRSSISDQDSHHSQSPPHSRHHSRSTSPPSKEKKPQKDKERSHHRTKSPGSHSSSRMNSPTKEIIAAEILEDKEICGDQREVAKHKPNDGKLERSFNSLSLPLVCSKPDDDVITPDLKLQIKSESESTKKRIHMENETTDHLLSVTEAASRIERKKRLLISAGCVLNRDATFLGNHIKDSMEQTSLKIRNISHGNVLYSKLTKSDCNVENLTEGTNNEECKSDAESGELLEEGCLVKNTAGGECPNNDLKYLKKKQVHLLHLLEQLGEGVSSSDTECSTDSEKPFDKKKKLHDLNLCIGREQIKTNIKQELSIVNDNLNAKDNSNYVSKQKDGYKHENNDTSLLKAMDTSTLKKYLDPRKSIEYQDPSIIAQRIRRRSSDKDILCHSDSNQLDLHGDQEIQPLIGLPDTTWKNKTFPTVCITSVEDLDPVIDSKVISHHPKGKDDDTSVNETISSENFSNIKQCRIQGSVIDTRLIGPVQKSLSETICSAHELRREREISPLSLPLPKFAASLRSPKMSPNPLSSPKSSAMSPRAGHSPNTVIPGKSNFINEIIKSDKIPIKDIKDDKTVINTIVSALPQVQISKSKISSELASNPTNFHSPQILVKPSEIEISSDSENSPISSPNRPSIEERIRALDEKFNAWSGSSRTFSALPGDTSPTVTTVTTSSTITTTITTSTTSISSTFDYQKYNIKKRPRFSFLSPEFRTEPSEITKSLLAKSTIFDQDSKRLERINEKYEPKEVKLDLSPKTKPLVRTKAAAKEFSTPITPLTNTVSSLALTCSAKYPQFSQPSVTVSNAPFVTTSYATNSSVTSLGLSNQCTVPFVSTTTATTTTIVPPSSTKIPEESTVAQPKVANDQVPSLSKLLETIKPQSMWKEISSISNNIQLKPSSASTNSSVFSLYTSATIKKEPSSIIKENSYIPLLKKDPREDKSILRKEFCNISSAKDTQVRRDGISSVIFKECILKRDKITKENIMKKENTFSRELIKMEPLSNSGQEMNKKDNIVTNLSKDSSLIISNDLSSTVTPAGIMKRRVSSIDSNESDSGKSAKSTEMKEVMDNTWQKDDLNAILEPENKKLKLSHNVKNPEKERQPEKSTSPIHSKKPEKSLIRTERSKSLGSRYSISSVERDELETKSLDIKYSDSTKEKFKSETKHREDKKFRCKESKGNRQEHRMKTKWTESSKSEKSDSKSGQMGTKSRKDHDRCDKERSKSERRLSGSDKNKSDQSKSSRRSEMKHHFVEEEPVYFSMYDKVKARSSQNQSLKDQAKDLESVRQKFNLLKQSRAKREEKTKSIEMDSDKDSDASHHSNESETQGSHIQKASCSKNKQSKKRKLVIESSSDDDMDMQCQNMRPEGSRHDCKDTSNELPSDLENEYRELTSMKKFNISHNSKQKGKRTGLSDSGSSGSEEQNRIKSPTTNKKKTKHSTEKLSKRHIHKSDYDSSDTEATAKTQNKEKDHKRKKNKKDKIFEMIKTDSDISDNEASQKFKEDKCSKNKVSKDCEDETSSVLDDNVSHSESKIQLIDKSKADSKATENTDKDQKHKSISKKKKKSKKSSKNKEKRLSSEKSSELFQRTENAEEFLKLQPKTETKEVPIVSKIESHITDNNPASPCLQSTILSDNDFKSDFSDFEFDSQKAQNLKLNSDLWKNIETKTDSDTDVCLGNLNSPFKCTTENFSSKDQSDNQQSATDSSLPSFLDKAGECEMNDVKPVIPKIELCDPFNENNTVNTCFNPLLCEVNINSIKKEESIKQENVVVEGSKKKEKNDNECEKNKEDKKKKKNKKTLNKRKKPKNEYTKTMEVMTFKQKITESSTPVFEKLSLIDEDSRLSNERLDEEIAEEARRLEEELLAQSEETSTFGDSEDPCKKDDNRQEKSLENPKKEEKQERRFDEEAVKETRRLEEELQTTRDPWNLKDPKLYDDTNHDLQILTDDVSKEDEIKVDLIVGKENLYSGIELGANSDIGVPCSTSQDFLLTPANPDHYKLEDKEVLYDMDNQRKIEDDLAVSALLQEMNSEEAMVPELSKESDYLEPLLESQENSLNYIIPDDTTEQLHITDSSPEITLEENLPQSKCETDSEFIPQESVPSELLPVVEDIQDKEISAKNELIVDISESNKIPEIENAEDPITTCEEPKQQELESITDKQELESGDKLPQVDLESGDKLPQVDLECHEETNHEFDLLNVTVVPVEPEDKKLNKNSQEEETETFHYHNNSEETDETDDVKLTFEDITADGIADESKKKEENALTIEKVEAETAVVVVPENPPLIEENENDKKLELEEYINENTNLIGADEPTEFVSDTITDLDDTRTASPSYPSLEDELNSIKEEADKIKQALNDETAENSKSSFLTDKFYDKAIESITTKEEVKDKPEDLTELVVEIPKLRENNTETIEESTVEMEKEIKTDISPDKQASGEEFVESASEKEVTNLFDEPLSIVLESEEKKQTEKPKRGRRPKTRKYSESSLSLPRYEMSVIDTPAKQGNKRGRPPIEKSRRCLRSETSENTILEPSPDILPPREEESVNSFAHENPNPVPSNNECNTSVISSDEIVESTETNTNVINTEMNDTPSETVLCTKANDQILEPIKEEPRKRGRRKKKTSDHHSNYFSPPGDKNDTKHDESDHKDHHKPKESRLWLSISSEKALSEHKLSSKETSSAYDVFEFRGSEDEETTFERDFQSSVKERFESRTSYGHDHRHHETKNPETSHEREKKHDESRHKSHHHDERDTTGKEYVTELSQHGKISITIRLHQKEGHDGSSTGTAEVVKTSEAVCGEDHKIDLARCEKNSVKESVSPETRSSSQVRTTRKSTRLQCQNARSTIDEVIEEVVKGHFKTNNQSDMPVRVTRRTRLNRRSEENQQLDEIASGDSLSSEKIKNEPVFVILDNTVKEYSTEVKKCLISPPEVLQNKTPATTENETNKSEMKMSLRSYRITRSSARMEANKDNIASKNLSDTNKDTVIESNTDSSQCLKNEHLESKEPPVGMLQAKDIVKTDHFTSRTLPVLKVEIPKVSTALTTVEVKTGENEDSDSRASPTVLIDPVTGFLMPVNKNGESSEGTDGHSYLKSIRTLHLDKLSASSVITSKNSNIPLVSLADSSVAGHSVNIVSPAGQNVRKLSTEDSDQSQVTTSTVHQMVGQTSFPTPILCGPNANQTTSSIQNPSELKSSLLTAPESLIHQPASSEEKSEKCTTQTVISTSVVHAVSSATTCVPSSETKLSNSTVSNTKQLPPVGQPPVSIGQVPTWPVTTVSGSSYHSYSSVPITTQCAKASRNTPIGYSQSTKPVIPLTTVTESTNIKIVPPLKVPISSVTGDIPAEAVSRIEGTTTCTTATVTQTVAHSDVCTITSSDTHSNSEQTPVHQTGQLQGATRTDNSGNWNNCKTPPSRSTPSSAELSRHIASVPTTSPSRTTSAVVLTTSVKTEHFSTQLITNTTTKTSHSHSSKQSPTFLHKSGLTVPPYDSGSHTQHSLTTSNNGGVIAELLQNPHLLQQQKDYFATSQHSVSGSAQIGDRLSTHLVRSANPTSALHTDIATRLGNPTPPHTPTPPVTSATHPLQPPEIHPAHVAAGLHLRQPPLIVPSHAPLPIHPSELNAFVHQQMLYAAAHPHYAAMHPEIRVQQEAQARAAVMGIAPRFPYPHVPPNVNSSGGFRQPHEPRQHTSVSDSKSDIKPLIEASKTVQEHRLHDDKEKSHISKGIKIKQETDRDGKTSSEMKGHSTMRNEDQDSTCLEGKQLNLPSGPLNVGGLRPPHVSYPPSIRQLNSHLSLSAHERITDSPVVANLYAQGQLRTTPLHLVVQSDDHKGSDIHPHAQSVKSEMTEKESKPPAAHQNPPTTVPYHALDTLGHHNRQSMSMPSVGSPAPGYLEGRPVAHLAHSSGALALKTLVPPQPISQTHSLSSETHNHESHKKSSRTHSHQGPSPSPGPLGVNTAHSPLPVLPNFSSHSPHPTIVSSHTFPPPSAEPIHRRGNLHLIPQMGSEAPIHAPPPAHAMSQPSGVPRTQPQTPPHASQVPPQGDSFLLQRYPVMWQGLLALKNDQAAVQMHFVSGSPRIARASLPPMTEGGTPPVRIAQRMRLEQTQLEGVARKMQMVEEHCILLALPCGRDHMDVLQQSNNLRNGFINYLQLKQAAGIVNAAAPGSQQPAYVIHIFPSCEFSNENMARIAPDLLHSVSDIAHLLIIIATV